MIFVSDLVFTILLAIPLGICFLGEEMVTGIEVLAGWQRHPAGFGKED